MSAALTLPYVWAVAGKVPVRRKYVAAPLSGVAFYRKHTQGLLRRYLRASLSVGRVPSVLGDMTMRGRVSSYRMKNFEDVVIFAIDVERCLKTLEPAALEILVKVVLQEYTMAETGVFLGIPTTTVQRSFGYALDALTEKFLEKGLLI